MRAQQSQHSATSATSAQHQRNMGKKRNSVIVFYHLGRSATMLTRLRVCLPLSKTLLKEKDNKEYCLGGEGQEGRRGSRCTDGATGFWKE
jgi:hypothetical protein